MNRVKFLQRISLSAGIALAMAFTASCSDDKSDDPPPSSSSVTVTGGGGSSSSVTTPGGGGSSSSVTTPGGGGSSSSVAGGYTGTYGAVEHEGKSYKTVVIGTQTWMAENLNFDAATSKCYGDLPANCETYGRLYNWVTAMDLPAECATTDCSDQIDSPHQGICPDGWHLPDYLFNADEFAYYGDLQVFKTFTGSNNGTKLKATSLWTSGNGTDILGFGALPGGRFTNTNFYALGTEGSWWGASEHTSSKSSAFYIVMLSSSTSMNTSNDSKAEFRSVRCLKNNP